MSWNPKIGEQVFADHYAHASHIDLEALLRLGRGPRPCACHDDGCEGWMMVNMGEYDADVIAWRRGKIPHPGGLSVEEWNAFHEG